MVYLSLCVPIVLVLGAAPATGAPINIGSGTLNLRNFQEMSGSRGTYAVCWNLAGEDVVCGAKWTPRQLMWLFDGIATCITDTTSGFLMGGLEGTDEDRRWMYKFGSGPQSVSGARVSNACSHTTHVTGAIYVHYWNEDASVWQAVENGAHTHWRIRDHTSPTPNWAFVELKLNGARPTGGTCYAQSNSGLSASCANAVDGNEALSSHVGGGIEWWSYQYSSPVWISSMEMLQYYECSAACNRVNVITFLLEWSDDGSSWTKAYECSFGSYPTAFPEWQTATLTQEPPGFSSTTLGAQIDLLWLPTVAQYWRVQLDGQVASPNEAYLTEWQWRGESTTTTTTTTAKPEACTAEDSCCGCLSGCLARPSSDFLNATGVLRASDGGGYCIHRNGFCQDVFRAAPCNALNTSNTCPANAKTKFHYLQPLRERTCDGKIVQAPHGCLYGMAHGKCSPMP